MKLVFYKSGDYLEFEHKNTKFGNEWFDFLFDNEVNTKYRGEQNCWHAKSTEERLKLINSYITDINQFLKITVPNNTVFFENNATLNQPWLNDTHKKWVMLTDRYKNEIYDIPWELKNAWSEINNIVHYIEQGYKNSFYNTLTSQMPKGLLTVTKEDCDFTQRDLVLNYDNLGRHQFNQWEVGAEMDEETNNYTTVSTSFTYIYSQQDAALKNFAPAPADYVEWCKHRNLEVLAPWVVLGRFKLSTYDVREIIHKNLKEDICAGFER